MVSTPEVLVRTLSNIYPDDSSLEEKQSLHLIKYFEKRGVFFFSFTGAERMDNEEKIKLRLKAGVLHSFK